VVEDDGVGSSGSPNRTDSSSSGGLGQQIISAMASKLGATLELDANHAGTRVLLRFPLTEEAAGFAQTAEAGAV
jgi:two-component sensor histidine kinase